MCLDSKKIKFETYNGNRYEFCSETSIVFREIPSNKIKYSDRKAKWNEYKSNLYNYNQVGLKELNTSKEVECFLYRSGFRQLSLEVTNACNLRCKYCSFSENYDRFRTHGYDYMTWETAKKAIDMYFKYYKEARNYNPNLRPVIGFYGGEPLLNFKLVKKCVEYIKSVFNKDDDIYMTITTNGVLLNDDIIQFFHINDVIPIVSLDGDKLSHDRNRVLQNGEGTFDVVMSNIRKIHDVTSLPVFTSSVYDVKTNLKDVLNFFDKNKYLCNITMSPVNPNGTDYYKQFSREDFDNYFKMENELLNEFIELVSNEENFKNGELQSKALLHFFAVSVSRPLMKIILQQNNGAIKYTGSCVPGNKLFVDVSGKLHMCEKISRDWSLGDVDSGIDFDKIVKLIKYYNSKTSNCSSCKIRKVCNSCFVSLEENGEINLKSSECVQKIQGYEKSLKLTYSVLEKNSAWFAFYLDDYYKEVRRLGGIKGC